MDYISICTWTHPDDKYIRCSSQYLCLIQSDSKLFQVPVILFHNKWTIKLHCSNNINLITFINFSVINIIFFFVLFFCFFRKSFATKNQI